MYSPYTEWEEFVYLSGLPSALKTISESLEQMFEDFKTYRSGTRKFKCNPPSDIDVIEYAKENKTKIKWLEWLTIKIESTVNDDFGYILEGDNVSITFDEEKLLVFIDHIKKQLDTSNQYPHGSAAPGRFYFSPDWLGIE